MVDLRGLTEDYIGFLPDTYIEREIELPATRDIVAVVGPRRAGKSFFLMITAKKLLDEGKQVIYLLMDDPELKDTKVRDFAAEVRSVYPSGEVYLFLDEVQEWRNWDWNLRWLHEVKDFRIFVSGSSYVLQETEVPSRLRGRFVSRLLLPFSFREVYRSGGSFREEGMARKVFREWMEWGGYPEVWLFRSREKLVSIFKTMMIRDVVEKHPVRDLDLFERVAYFILENYGNLLSYRSVSRLLRYEGIEISVKTVANFVRYMKEAFMVFVVERYSLSAREKLVSPKKIYLPDHGLIQLASKEDVGRKLENIVFLDLLRRGEEPKYYVTRDGKEIDFITRNYVIEVCVEPDEEHRRKLERARRETGKKPLLVSLEGGGDSISLREFLLKKDL